MALPFLKRLPRPLVSQVLRRMLDLLEILLTILQEPVMLQHSLSRREKTREERKQLDTEGVAEPGYCEEAGETGASGT